MFKYGIVYLQTHHISGRHKNAKTNIILLWTDNCKKYHR